MAEKNESLTILMLDQVKAYSERVSHWILQYKLCSNQKHPKEYGSENLGR